MLEKLLQMKVPLSITVSNIPGKVESLEATEFNIIADCVQLLKPIELMTAVLSGEKYVTISVIIPLVRGL